MPSKAKANMDALRELHHALIRGSKAFVFDCNELDSILSSKLDRIGPRSLMLRRGGPDRMDGWIRGVPDESP